MFVDWLIQKKGMLLAFFMTLWSLQQVYLIHDKYGATKEIEEVAQDIADQIGVVANSAPEYSAGRNFSKTISLPEEIHGDPYILAFDIRGILKITLIGKNISEFAVLPEAVTTDAKGNLCILLEGFNTQGKISVGTPLSSMNTSTGITVTKTPKENYCLKISAGI